MADKKCGTCIYIAGHNDKDGQFRRRKGRLYDCAAPEPALPYSVRLWMRHNRIIDLPRIAVEVTDGTDCAAYAPLRGR